MAFWIVKRRVLVCVVMWKSMNCQVNSLICDRATVRRFRHVGGGGASLHGV
jgi:hypothetical protein